MTYTKPELTRLDTTFGAIQGEKDCHATELPGAVPPYDRLSVAAYQADE